VAIFFYLLLVFAVSMAPENAARAEDEAAISEGLSVAEVGLSASEAKVYRAAFAAAQENRWNEARELAELGGDPLPAKIIQWLDLTRLDTDASFEELAAFVESNPHWPDRAIIEAQAERVMPNGLPPEVVLKWFGDRMPHTVAGSIRRGRAMIAAGLAAEAIRPIRRDWVRLDMTAREEKEFLAHFESYLLPQDHVARLDRLLWDRDVGAARRMLNRVGAAHRALAEARIALMTRRSGVDAAIDRVPSELLNDPGLVYERARWRRRHGRAETAIELLDQPLAGPGRPDVLWPERRHAARLALQRGNVAAAYRLAKAHGATDGLAFAEGEWLAGWIGLRFMEEPKTAYAHFTRLYAGVRSSISRARGAYWSGRAAEALGDATLAQNWYETAARYPTTFYGQLAAHRLGQEPGMRFRSPPEPTEAQRAAFAERELVRVIRMLALLGDTDRAEPFILRLAEFAETPVEHALIAELATGIGRDDFAVLASKEARQRSGIELVEYLFPLRHLPDSVGIEEALVLAVMRQESAFATDALSSAGARGLMQLMPATARQVARHVGLKYSKARLTEDPEFNIQLGSAYLEGLLRQFDGSYLLAIAAYNAGPARVQQWIRANGDPRTYGVDPVDWIEAIPFSETRNYVQRVLENLQVYRHRLGGPVLAFSLEQDISRRVRY